MTCVQIFRFRSWFKCKLWFKPWWREDVIDDWILNLFPRRCQVEFKWILSLYSIVFENWSRLLSGNETYGWCLIIPRRWYWDIIIHRERFEFLVDVLRDYITVQFVLGILQGTHLSLSRSEHKPSTYSSCPAHEILFDIPSYTELCPRLGDAKHHQHHHKSLVNLPAGTWNASRFLWPAKRRTAIGAIIRSLVFITPVGIPPLYTVFNSI